MKDKAGIQGQIRGEASYIRPASDATGRVRATTPREDVTYHHCHASADDLTRRVALFEAKVNQDPCVVADRLWVKDCLDPEEEKLRFSD